MELKPKFLFLAVMLVAQTPLLLESRDLRLEEDNQSKANALGIDTWCRVCKATAEFVSTQLFLAASTSITVGEAMLLRCSSSTGFNRKLCERIISYISEGIGAGLSKKGEIILPSCSLLPLCSQTNSAVEISDSTSNIFEYICTQCKVIAAIWFGELNSVATSETLESQLRPFCKAMSIASNPESCVTDVATRIHQMKEQENFVLNPNAVCAAYEVCAPTVVASSTKERISHSTATPLGFADFR